jgi:hypothetical protein
MVMVTARDEDTMWRVHLPPFSSAEQIMAMPVLRTPHRRWTEEEFYRARDAAPPGERWELVDGEVLVTPSPHWSHQRVMLRLAILLDDYVRKHALGEVFVSPLDGESSRPARGRPRSTPHPSGANGSGSSRSGSS